MRYRRYYTQQEKDGATSVVSVGLTGTFFMFWVKFMVWATILLWPFCFHWPTWAEWLIAVPWWAILVVGWAVRPAARS